MYSLISTGGKVGSETNLMINPLTAGAAYIRVFIFY